MYSPPFFAFLRCTIAVGRHLWVGLVHVGNASAALWTGEFLRERRAPHRPPRDLLEGPPPGHPERLIPHLPPSDEERLLWRQLRP